MFNLRGMRKALLVGAAAAGLAGASAAQAALVLDLRLAGAGPGAGKSAVVNPGDVVQLQLYGVVTGTNGVDDEAMHNAYAALRSSTGGALGDFAPGQVHDPFRTGAFSGGTAVDVDGDGDLDIGREGAASTATPTLLFARADPGVVGTFGVNGERVTLGTSTDAEQFLLATINFTVSPAALPGQTTELRAIRPNITGIFQASLYRQDGVSVSGQNTVGGDPVTLTIIPEPMGLAAVGALGLLARRRRA
ncbi:MYXO-CTERM sorting domain-containing protein [Fontivita pretiosa]|uniref:MYXO-CTERM sorting domain-containing protein n=1 Tax=Fontivita pretiosa TaxID=2989684 RepID=UPI003D175AA8